MSIDLDHPFGKYDHLPLARVHVVDAAVLPEPPEPRTRPQGLTFAEELAICIENSAASNSEAIVVLNVLLGDEHWQVTGSSRRDRADVPNKDVGLLLALARALQTTARHIERQAEGKMKHDADVRDSRRKPTALKVPRLAVS